MPDPLNFIHPEFTGEELTQLHCMLTELMEPGSVLKASYLMPQEVLLLQGVVDKIGHMSDTPLWRTLPQAVQEAIVQNYMDMESLDDCRAEDELNRVTDLDELYRCFSDPELLSSVHLGECCLSDFKDYPQDPKTDSTDPEVYHWEAWQLMQQVGLCTEDGKVTDRGIAHIRWDDEKLLE